MGGEIELQNFCKVTPLILCHNILFEIKECVVFVNFTFKIDLTNTNVTNKIIITNNVKIILNIFFFI